VEVGQAGNHHPFEPDRFSINPKDLGLNLSGLAERWLMENTDAIQAFNERTGTHGVFSDGFRAF
jgi:post-segregation antitoxin (ccd killing protein)